MYEEPQYIVKKEKQVWAKNHITNGDFLILKSEQDILPDEQVIIDIHETKTGVPNDCQNIGHVKLRDSDTIDDLKEAIIEMEEYRDKPEVANIDIEKIRLRVRSRNLFFGKIFREKNKTLKQLKIKSGVHLVVQFLSEPEDLKNNEMVLLVRKRDIKNMSYHDFIEFNYSFEKAVPTLEHLRLKLSEVVGIRAENIDVAKYIPHAYDWKYWDPNEDVEIKKKGKGKQQKGKKKGKQTEDPKEEEDKKVETEKLIK